MNSEELLLEQEKRLEEAADALLTFFELSDGEPFDLAHHRELMGNLTRANGELSLQALELTQPVVRESHTE